MNTAMSDNDSLLAQLAHQQQELESLRARLALKDQALDCMRTHFLIARHVKGDSIIHFCNRVVAEQQGLTPEVLKGQSIRVIFGNQWNLDEMRARGAALARGEWVEAEQELHRKDGTSIWLGLTLIPVRWDAEGRLAYSMAIGADITARREAQRREKELREQLVTEMKKRERVLLELRVAQKLESVGRLAAGIAHEINTPIQYVTDSLHFLRSSFEDVHQLIGAYQQVIKTDAATLPAESVAALGRTEERIDLPFLDVEIPKAFERTFEGVTRVTSIVRAMKEFSHPDVGELSPPISIMPWPIP